MAALGGTWFVWSHQLFVRTDTRNLLTVQEYGHYSCMCTVSHEHYNDVIMIAMASQITSLTIVGSTICSAADQRKHQSSASLAFVRGIHRGPVNSPHKGPGTRKMFPFNDVIMKDAYGVVLPRVGWGHIICVHRVVHDFHREIRDTYCGWL